MKCENSFCIYQENGFCLLDEITLNISGQCYDCITITLEEKELNRYKESLRNSIEKNYEKD